MATATLSEMETRLSNVTNFRDSSPNATISVRKIKKIRRLAAWATPRDPQTTRPDGHAVKRLRALVPLGVEHAVAGIAKSWHDKLVIIQLGINSRHKNLDFRELLMELLDTLFGGQDT